MLILFDLKIFEVHLVFVFPDFDFKRLRGRKMMKFGGVEGGSFRYSYIDG